MERFDFVLISFFVSVVMLTTFLCTVYLPIGLGSKKQIVYAQGCPNPPDYTNPACCPDPKNEKNPVCCSDPDDHTNPACCPDPPDYTHPACISKTYDQIDGGFKFSGNTFKSYGQGILTAGSGIILGIAVLKIIFGGVMYATAAGNAQKIEEAKSHILYALLGIALIVGMHVLLLLLGAETY